MRPSEFRNCPIMRRLLSAEHYWRARAGKILRLGSLHLSQKDSRQFVEQPNEILKKRRILPQWSSIPFCQPDRPPRPPWPRPPDASRGRGRAGEPWAHLCCHQPGVRPWLHRPPPSSYHPTHHRLQVQVQDILRLWSQTTSPVLPMKDGNTAEGTNAATPIIDHGHTEWPAWRSDARRAAPPFRDLPPRQDTSNPTKNTKKSSHIHTDSPSVISAACIDKNYLKICPLQPFPPAPADQAAAGLLPTSCTTRPWGRPRQTSRMKCISSAFQCPTALTQQLLILATCAMLRPPWIRFEKGFLRDINWLWSSLRLWIRSRPRRCTRRPGLRRRWRTPRPRCRPRTRRCRSYPCWEALLPWLDVALLSELPAPLQDRQKVCSGCLTARKDQKTFRRIGKS